ncbi:MAG: sensor domain-containing diguanylate cyclase [Candidatus Omnitrophica bacterium]|nr:sensor domain-containing diguanylate cyclase [Candidatus Omnitrophota bacterium]
MLNIYLSIPVLCVAIVLVLILIGGQEIRIMLLRKRLDEAIVGTEKRNIQLSYLIKTAQNLSSALSKDKLLRLIIETVGEITKSERVPSLCALYLMDYNANIFTYETGFNMDVTMLKHTSYGIDDTPFKVFRKNRELAFFDDTESIKTDFLKEAKASAVKEADFAIMAPLLVENEVMGIVVSFCAKSTFEFLKKDLYLLQAIVGQASIALGSAVQSELAVLDRLTKVYNHAYFEGRLEQEIARSNRYKYPVSVLMIDIDHFKLINDTYGHQQGDTILKEVARIIKANTRTVDLCARYGGEEFAIILPETDLTTFSKRDEITSPGEAGGALAKAENLRKVIEQSKILSPDGKPIRLTISIGIGVKRFPGGESIGREDIIREADRQLYCAKEKGRNTVCHG